MLELVQYWIDHKQFGTLTAMTEAAVAAKLNEPDKYRPDNTDLTVAKARKGAERLATAMTLAKTFTLIAPGQEPDPTLASGALDPAALMSDWTLAESNALLRRGIFAPSTYGRIRFHHRSTQEYLTACWLKRLIDNGCQRSEIFRLIFTDRYGVETVVPSLRSAAAWLALHYSDVRDEIIRREPLMLITYGDPAALSTETKTSVLVNFARKHAAGEIADDSIDRRALGLFGSPDLSDAIHEAWKINSRLDFRVDLIRLVREGRIMRRSRRPHGWRWERASHSPHRSRRCACCVRSRLRIASRRHRPDARSCQGRAASCGGLCESSVPEVPEHCATCHAD
jgi:hypothetical protein